MHSEPESSGESQTIALAVGALVAQASLRGVRGFTALSTLVGRSLRIDRRIPLLFICTKNGSSAGCASILRTARTSRLSAGLLKLMELLGCRIMASRGSF